MTSTQPPPQSGTLQDRVSQLQLRTETHRRDFKAVERQVTTLAEKVNDLGKSLGELGKSVGELVSASKWIKGLVTIFGAILVTGALTVWNTALQNQEQVKALQWRIQQLEAVGTEQLQLSNKLDTLRELSEEQNDRLKRLERSRQ